MCFQKKNISTCLYLLFFFRHNTLQRSVRFEEVVLTSTTAASVCPSSVSPASVSNRKLVASASVEAASETDGLLDATMPLPQVSITLFLFFFFQLCTPRKTRLKGFTP